MRARARNLAEPITFDGLRIAEHRGTGNPLRPCEFYSLSAYGA